MLVTKACKYELFLRAERKARRAINALNWSKVAGPDGLTAEIFIAAYFRSATSPRTKILKIRDFSKNEVEGDDPKENPLFGCVNWRSICKLCN